MEFYHLLNRGVDKRSVVLDEQDRVRFIHDLFVFNDVHASANFLHPPRPSALPARPRKLLVHLHAFCLMGNHYHLLVSPAVESGVSLFMKKLNMGYAKYFNEKYGRTGALWQGKYKRIRMERDAQFLYIPYYIHLNPLDLQYPGWREGKVAQVKKALAYLRTYRWSSHADYLGEKNFPSLTQRGFLSGMLGSRQKYEKEIGRIITTPSLATGSTRIE